MTGATFGLELVKTLRSLVLPEVREVGDLRRNAALFLARQVGDRRSSFERDLRPSLDLARLSEVPYLAAIGYLIAAGVLAHVPIDPLRASLEKTLRRAPHTAERTGYADDASCACGLLLLATAVNDEAIAEGFREQLRDSTASDSALATLVTVATGSVAHHSFTPDSSSPEQVGAAVLLHRIDASLARALFPGFPNDLEGHFLALLAKHTHALAADFDGMLALVALETIIAVPEDELPAVDGPCDVGVLVALKEEFRVLFERFEGRHTLVEDGGRSYYLFEVTTRAAERPYRCVATLVGDMGTNRAGVIAEKMLGRWDPALMVVIGLAGGIHKDIRLGDVVIASEVSNYVEGAKAAEATDGFHFERAGDSFKTKHALLDRVRNFEFANRASFQRWEAACESRQRALGVSVEPLRTDELLRLKPAQREGHVASGPFVVTSRAFVNWIREGDRACLCVEMETAGVMLTAHMDPSQRDVLVVRAISDFADERKAALDKIGGGALRTYAMDNALDFLWSLMEAGALPRGPDPVAAPQVPTSPVNPKEETVEAALLRVLHEHADHNGEVSTTWRELRDCLGGTSADVQQAAIHLKQDGYFRSQLFESGPDGTCNVVLRR